MRTLIISLLIAIFYCAIPHNNAAALSDKEMCVLLGKLLATQLISSISVPKDPYLCRSSYWIGLRTKPLKAILTANQLTTYRKAIKEKRCSDAARFLSKYFVKAHPEVPSILENKENYRRWKNMTVTANFIDLGICLLLEKIRTAQKEIDRLEIEAKPFRGYDKSLDLKNRKYLSTPEVFRHLGVFGLLNMFGRFKNPNLVLALIKLSVEGKALKFNPEYEYYLAYALHTRGLEDPVIKQILSRPLNAQRRKYIERMAKNHMVGDIQQ